MSCFRRCCSQRYVHETTYHLALPNDQNPRANTRTVYSTITNPGHALRINRGLRHDAFAATFQGAEGRLTERHYRQVGWWKPKECTSHEYTDATAVAIRDGEVFYTTLGGLRHRAKSEILDNPSVREALLHRTSPASIPEAFRPVAVPARTRIVTDEVQLPPRGCWECVKRVLGL